MQDSSDQYDELAQSTPASPSFSTGRLLAALRRKWWILVLTSLLPIGPAIYYVRTQPIQYVSKATAWVRGKLHVADVGQYAEDGQNFFGTQIQLLQSDPLQERALARLKSTNPDLEPPKSNGGRQVLPRIRVVQAPKSSVFVLESTSSSAAFAKVYLDALMDEFLAYRKEVRAATSGDALASVSAQVYKQETELKQEQEKLAQFQRENNVALLEENLRGGGGQLAQMNTQIALLKLELQLLIASAIEKKAGVGGQTNTVPSVPDLTLISGIPGSTSGSRTDFAAAQQQLEMLVIQREQLSVYLRPKHPKIVRLNDEISRTEKLIEFHRTRSEEQINATREANQLRLRSMEEAAKELAEKVGDANRRLAELERIRAGIGRQQIFYERLLALLQGVDLNSSMNQEDVAILERASDARPPKSQDVAILLGAAVGGLMLGVGILFLLVRLDDRCESLIDLKAQFPEPVFGQVPEVEVVGPDGQLPVLQLDDPRHIFVESCRGLRSSLLFGAGNGQRPKVILVTSAAPDEGKSTIAINLASALAQGGSRVLLVDADLRRGCLHKLLGVPREPGISDCVQKGGELVPFVVPSAVPGLFLLARGAASQAAGDLFLSCGFANLLQQARQQYDFIIVDTIPVFAADDSTTLAPKVDGVLFVVRRAHTSARLAQDALDLLYQRQAKILGIIFNRADSRSRSYNYYKYSKYYAEESKA